MTLKVPEDDKEGECVTEGEKEPDCDSPPLRLKEGEPDPPSGLPLPLRVPVSETLGLAVALTDRVGPGQWEGEREEVMHVDCVLVGEREREGDLDWELVGVKVGVTVTDKEVPGEGE